MSSTLNNIEFLSPRLVGERFSGHAIPLEVLRDLAVLEEMLVETAKWGYMQEHPDRKRIPRGFTNGVSLKLTGIEEGSAIPKIALFFTLAGTNLDRFPSDNAHYFHQAKNSIVNAVNAAEQNRDIKEYLPENLLCYFDRIGRSLRDGESLELNPADTAQPARLNKTTRRKLLLASSNVLELTEEITLRGSIPAADQAKMTFDLHIISGPTVSVPISPQHCDIVKEAFMRYGNGGIVMLQGIGRFNRNNRLQSIDSVEHISLLDANDVLVQLDELRSLENGWLDGEGVAPGKEGLDWLVGYFETYYSDELPVPCIYPTPEGGVQIEWALNGYEITLAVNIDTRQGEFHALNMSNDDEIIKSLDFNKPDDCVLLNQELKTLSEAEV